MPCAIVESRQSTSRLLGPHHPRSRHPQASQPNSTAALRSGGLHQGTPPIRHLPELRLPEGDWAVMRHIPELAAARRRSGRTGELPPGLKEFVSRTGEAMGAGADAGAAIEEPVDHVLWAMEELTVEANEPITEVSIAQMTRLFGEMDRLRQEWLVFVA